MQEYFPRVDLLKNLTFYVEGGGFIDVGILTILPLNDISGLFLLPSVKKSTSSSIIPDDSSRNEVKKENSDKYISASSSSANQKLSIVENIPSLRFPSHPALFLLAISLYFTREARFVLQMDLFHATEARSAQNHSFNCQDGRYQA